MKRQESTLRPSAGLAYSALIFTVVVLILATGVVRERSAPLPTRPEAPAAGLAGAGLPFIENRGQVDGEVAFYAMVGERTVSVTRTGRIVHALAATGEPARPERGWSIHEELVGGRPVAARGREPAATRVNYLAAGPVRDAENGATRGVPAWRSVELSGAYPGIDVELVAGGNGVEKLFHVAPGAQVEEIRVRVAGAQGLRVTEDGRLELATGIGALHFTRPVAYQEVGGERREVEAAYAVAGQEYGFRVGPYDPGLPLTIDPLLASTYLGGAAQDGFSRIQMLREADGDVLIAGGTSSNGFPATPGAYDPSPNGLWDLAIARLDSSLTTLEAATFLGGSGDDGRSKGACLALGPDGSVYVASETQSANYPTTAGAYDASLGGGRDIVISRLSSGLDTLLASTYLGGALDDEPTCLSVGPQGEVHLGGVTMSTNFPTTAGAYDRTAGGGGDGFIVRLDPSLSTLVAATYLGGSGLEHVVGFIRDGAGSLFLTGFTESANFPTTVGAYDRAHTAFLSGWLAKMPENLATLQAATYFDGSVSDFPYAIALGTTGDVFITGHTCSTDMPTTPGAYDRTYNGSPDAESDDVFFARFSPDLTTLVAATFLGGAAFEYGMTLQCDGQGQVLAAGRTASAGFPVLPDAFSTMLRGTDDLFICKLDEGLTQLLASTYLGGNDYDSNGLALALDPSGFVYVSGRTYSADFPTTAGAYDRTYNGEGDWFVCQLDGDLLQGSTWPTGVEPPRVDDAIGLALRVEPNPFNPRTTVRFDLPAAGPVRLAIYDLAGRLVRTLVDGTLPAGSQRVVWDGLDDSGRSVGTGVYSCRLHGGGTTASRRISLVR